MVQICKICKKRYDTPIKSCCGKKLQTFNKCEICKKEFHPVRLKQRMCSKECKGKMQTIKGTSKKGKKYPHLQRARIGKCPICKKKFRAIKDFKKRKQKYCSKECWSARNPPQPRICEFCKKTFMTYTSRKDKFCSKKCSDEAHKEIFKGEKSCKWKGGKTKQDKVIRQRADYREWRDAVFKRDNYTCQGKGCNNSKYVQAHHIKSVSEHPELIYDVDNGKTLCVDCHQKEHPNLHLNLKKSIKNG